MENNKKTKTSVILLAAAIAIIVLATAMGTVAWFTTQEIVETVTSVVPGKEGNAIVDTGKAKTRTNNQSAGLFVSTKGGSEFTPLHSCDLDIVNVNTFTKLMPVSTADLETFIGNSMTVDNKTVKLAVTDDSNYYHGRFFVKADASGFEDNARMKLYLDDAEGNIVTADGEIINASRLGFTVNETNPQIFSLSDDENSEGGRISNTYIDGVFVPDGNVLKTDDSGKITAAADPAADISKCTVNSSGTEIKEPEKMLVSMEPGVIYQIDVYFYLEGCDPDCSDAVSNQKTQLNIGLYGIFDY